MRRLACLGIFLSPWGLSFSHATPLPEAAVQAAAQRLDAALVKAREEEMQQSRSPDPQAPLPPPASDATFLRRACIDLAGRLPTPAEVRQFLADASPTKRAQWVDRLLAEPGAAEVRFRDLAEGLRVRDDVKGQSQAALIDWLRQAVREDLPYNTLLAQVLRSPGPEASDPAAHLLPRDGGDLLRTSTEIARAFLGADLHCAHCHDHPFADWTQRQAYEFANCFADSPATGLRLPPNYAYVNGKPGDAVPARYMPLTKRMPSDVRQALDAQPDPARPLRDQLALWFTGPQNDRFAQMGGLRLWHQLFGLPFQAGRSQRSDPQPWHGELTRHGCAAPPSWTVPSSYEEFDASQPAFQVVRALGVEFQQCGYRPREFLRILTRTAAYHREALTQEPWHALAAAPRLRRLPPLVTWDAWAQMLPPADAEARSSTQMPQVPKAAHPLFWLGQGAREWVDETRPLVSHQLTGFMIASPFIERVATSPQLLLGPTEPTQQVEDLFLRILSRLPGTAEKNAALQHLTQHPQTGPHDLAWALLNTSEFLFEP